MRSFEIFLRTGDQWLLAGAFDDAAAAIADAKSLVERSPVPIAARVIALENRTSGVIEWIIYEESSFPDRTDGDRHDEEAEVSGNLSEQPATLETQEKFPDDAPDASRPTRRRRRPKTPKPPPRRPLIPSRYAAALFVIAILGGIAVAAMRQPQSTWVFDTPEAQKPHALRNSWTGEIFR